MLWVAVLVMAWPFAANSEQGGAAQKPEPTEMQGTTGPTRQSGETSEEPKKEERESFKADARKTVGELNRGIAALGEEVKKSGSNIGAEAKSSWDEVKEKRKDVRRQYKALQSAGEATWDSAKSEFNRSLNDLRKAYDRAASYFK